MGKPTLREKEIVAHYRRFLGKEGRIVRFDDMPEPAPSTIRVLEYPSRFEGDTWVYATVGASDKPMPDPNRPALQPDDPRMELVVTSSTQQSQLIDTLQTLAAYPFVLNTYLGWDHVIAGTPNSGIVDGSPLTEVLLAPPSPAEMAIVSHKDGTHTHVLLVVPIYLSERLYVREHGSEALAELFAEREVDAADLWRPPAV
jgi:hypothetical protein